MLNKRLNLTDTEENIKFLLENAPFKLDTNDNIVREIGLYYLPYSTGIEVECKMIEDLYLTDDVKTQFQNIPNIIEVDVNIYNEQRFRIPNGIEGLICLFDIANLLRKYAYPNNESGLHYHIDCTDFYEEIEKELFMKHKDYILSELDKWDYKGTYNRRTISIDVGGVWVRLQSFFKTMEFRIGEMTFDYNLLFKRITHLNTIVRTIKSDIQPVITKYGNNNIEIIKTRKIQI